MFFLRSYKNKLMLKTFTYTYFQINYENSVKLRMLLVVAFILVNDLNLANVSYHI